MRNIKRTRVFEKYSKAELSENLKKLIYIVKSVGWNITDKGSVYVLSYCFSGERAFKFEISKDNILKYEDVEEGFFHEISNYYVNFDISYEAYQWLNAKGHGCNGAPSDMRDVYDLIDEYSEELEKLYGALDIATGRQY